jgi:acyl carrier protein
MGNTASRLAECFGAVFPGLGEKEIPKAEMASLADWDSLASVTLIGVVEEEFGIEVAPEDLEQFVSFERVLDYLQSRQP